MLPPLIFEALFENSPNSYVLLSPDFVIVAANAEYRKVTASRSQDLLGRNLFDAFPHDPDDPNNASVIQLRTSLQRVATTGKVDRIALIRYRVPIERDGVPVVEDRFWSATHVPILDANGQQVQFILQHTVDVSEMQQHLSDIPMPEGKANAPLPATTETLPRLDIEAGIFDRARSVQETNLLLDAERLHLRSLFEQAPGFVAFLQGPTHIFELANEAYYRLIGREDIIGKSAREALPEVAGQGFFELLDKVHRSGEPVVGRGSKLWIHRSEGEELDEVYVDFVYQPIIAPDGQVKGIFVQGSDVTEEKKAQDALRLNQMQLEVTVRERTAALAESEAERQRTLYLSQHDSLTGLPNRSRFHQELEQALEAANQKGTSIGVLFIDVDRFKEVNDSLGHHVGDMLLKGIAGRLKDCLRHMDVVARLGGDEFGVIIGNGADAEELAAKLVRELAEPFPFEGQQIVTGVSIGITLYPEDAHTSAQLLMNADMAMYRAKQNGRSTYERYTENLDTEAKRRHAVRDALRDALANGGLELHYQPVIALESGRICSVEALIRLPAEGAPLLTASELVTVAEDSGQVVPLGEWVLRTACRQIRQWQQEGLAPVRMAINISAQQLRDAQFMKLVDTVLEESGLDPTHLEFEITERMLVEKNRVNIAALQAFKDKGIKISVDDFGTGFSSLGYLKHFPVDMLKIDQIFVAGLPWNTHDAAITSAIINMAHGLNMKVIAEGVENEEQLRFLRSVGCDIGQGYYFDEVLSAVEVSERLKAAQWPIPA